MEKVLEVKNATSYKAFITFVDEDKKELLSLNGVIAEMQIRDVKNDNIIVELNQANGSISVDTENNEITLYIPPEVTAGNKHISGLYDLKLSLLKEDGTYEVMRELRGQVQFIPEVTR